MSKQGRHLVIDDDDSKKDMKSIITNIIDKIFLGQHKIFLEQRIEDDFLNTNDLLILCACFNLPDQLSKLLNNNKVNPEATFRNSNRDSKFAKQLLQHVLSEYGFVPSQRYLDEFHVIETDEALECKLTIQLIRKKEWDGKQHVIEEKVIDIDGTGLFVAAENGNLECAKILLEKNAALEATQKGNYTPLLIAAESGHKEIVKLLLERGAKIEARQKEGSTVVMVAAEALGFLEDQDSIKPKEDIFVGILDLLIKAKPELIHPKDPKDPKVKDSRNSNTLMHAAMWGNSKCLSKLLEYLDVNGECVADTEDRDLDGDNALSIAASNGHLNCVRLLLDRFDLKALRGESFNKFYDYLNSYSSDNKRNGNSEGKTPLILCCENTRNDNKNGDVLKYLLLEKGANLELKDNYGKGAYDYAFELNHQECIATIVGYKYNEDRTKDEKFLLSHPMNMFLEHDRLRKCSSPMKIIKEKLYTNESDSSFYIKKILEEHILNHPKALNYILTYQLSLVLAAKKNILEEEEILLKLTEIQLLLTEIFNSKSVESKETLIHMLLPDIVDKSIVFGSDIEAKKKWLLRAIAHSIGSESGVINYCLTHELKEIFGYSQISSLINDFFYTTLVPSTNSPNNHIFLISDFVKLGEIDLYKFREVKHFSENLRYNPFFTFISDLTSKAVTLGIVSYVAVDNGSYKESFEYALVTLIISKILYEVGQLAESNWKFSQYFDGWNLFDSIASCLLLVWLLGSSFGFDQIPTETNHLVLGCAAIPLSLGLLQSLSIFKKVGELLIIIKAMTYDVGSFLLVYAICLLGFSTCFNAFFFSGEFAIGFSMLTLFSATLGTFQFDYDFEQENQIRPYLYNSLLTLFLLGSAVILVNLLIARFSNTHHKLTNAAMKEWSYFMAKTTHQNMLLYERSVFCMLPPPFNLLTTFVYPVHWYFLNIYNHQGSCRISFSGSLSDKIYLILGQFIVAIYGWYIVICKYPKVFKRGSYHDEYDEGPRALGETDHYKEIEPTIFKKIYKNCYSAFRKVAKILFLYQMYLIVYTLLAGINVAWKMGFCYVNDDNTIKGLEVDRCEHISGGIEGLMSDIKAKSLSSSSSLRDKGNEDTSEEKGLEMNWTTNPINMVVDRMTEVYRSNFKSVNSSQGRRKTVRKSMKNEAMSSLRRIGEKIYGENIFFDDDDITRILSVVDNNKNTLDFLKQGSIKRRSDNFCK